MRTAVIRLVALGLAILVGVALFVWLAPRVDPPVPPVTEVRP